MTRLVRAGLIVVLAALAAPILAQDFNKGLAAAQAGDYETAFQEWLPLAEQGDATAQYFLGSMYANGWGVPQDFSEAIRWLRPAGEKGVVRAQTLLGMFHDEGMGVSEDDVEAVRWYRLAAEQGEVEAQMRLGFLLSRGMGKGVPKDEAEAVRWFRLAAEQGDVEGQTQLGLMIAQGFGAPQDFVLAHMWLHIAEENGNELVGAALEGLETTMTSEQIADAQARVLVCMATLYRDCE